MQVTIRFADNDEDLAAIYHLRYRLYVEDQGLFSEQADHERRWLHDKQDEHGRLLLAEVEGRVVGTLRMNFGADAPFDEETRSTYGLDRFTAVVDEGDIVVGTRLLVDPEQRGGSLSFQLLERGFECAAERNAELAFGDCEPHLVNLYCSLGFRPYRGFYNHPTNGMLVPLVIATGDLEGLRAMSSPMLRALSRRTRPSELVEQIRPLIKEHSPVLSKAQSDPLQYRRALTQWLGDDEVGLVGLLGELSRGETEVLLAGSHIFSCLAGDALIRDGHTSRTLYMLLHGSLEVRDNGVVVAQVSEPGALVGEVAFFSTGERMADVFAGEEGARVLSLSDRVLRKIIEHNPVVAAKFLYFVARALSGKLLERVAVYRAR